MWRLALLVILMFCIAIAAWGEMLAGALLTTALAMAGVLLIEDLRQRLVRSNRERELPLSLKKSALPLILLNEEERLIWLNEAARSLPFAVRIEVGQSLAAILPELTEERRARIRAELSQQGLAQTEVVRGASEQTDLVVVELVFVRYDDRQPPWTLLTATDITNRHLLELDQNQAKEQLEQFLENIPGGVFIKNASGTLIYQNRQSIFECLDYPALYQAISTPVISPIKNTGIPQTIQASHRRFAGDQREWEIWQFPLSTSTQELYAGICMDVTSLRRRERLLLESQAFLEATLNNSPVGLVILDGKTASVRMGNTGFKRLFGIPEKENLAGRSLNFDQLDWNMYTLEGRPFSVDENPLYRAFFRETLFSGRVMLRSRDGQTRYVLVNSSPIHGHDGQVLAVMVVFLEITDLFLAEAQLQRLNRELESRVEERTRQLKAANEELQRTIEELRETQRQLIETEKLAGLSNLVAGVAHEINNPVGVSLTAASYLGEATETLEAKFTTNTLTRGDLKSFLDNARQGIYVILANLERAGKLIQSFKLISVDQNTDPLREFSLKNYLEDVFRSLRPPDQRRRPTVTIEGDAELRVRSYPGAFSQIFTNLYMNSCIHGFDEGGGNIRVGFVREGPTLVLTYEDDGKGMDSEVLSRIFEPFFTTRRHQGGTGLGMHIVYNLVTQKLKGTIQAWSEPGRGCRFTLRLPEPAPEPSSDGSPAKPLPRESS